MVHELLRVEGTDRFEVLLYAVFSADVVMPHVLRHCGVHFSSLRASITHLVSDGWPAEVVLIEASVRQPNELTTTVAEMLRTAFEIDGCVAAVCMFDGAFASFDDIFSDNLADQTYAFCHRRNAEVVCMAYDVLSSDGWSRVVGEQRNAVRGRNWRPAAART